MNKADVEDIISEIRIFIAHPNDECPIKKPGKGKKGCTECEKVHQWMPDRKPGKPYMFNIPENFNCNITEATSLLSQLKEEKDENEILTLLNSAYDLDPYNFNTCSILFDYYKKNRESFEERKALKIFSDFYKTNFRIKIEHRLEKDFDIVNASELISKDG